MTCHSDAILWRHHHHPHVALQIIRAHLLLTNAADLQSN